MLFNSWTYILFFITVAITLRIKFIPWKYSLAFFSLVFYVFWDYRFLPLILFVTVINFLAANAIEHSKNIKITKLILITAVSINLAILIFFKYILLLITGIENLFEIEISRAVSHSIILPLGISFYIFQAISYVVDVYRREKNAENSYINFMLFIIFFPQLIAGPIMRANQLLPQLYNRPKVTQNDIRIGANYFINGLFLKVVLADNISPLVDAAFEVNPDLLGFLDISTMAFLFGWQIYFDFFGYSLIALGSARILGIKLVDNFRDPYISQSIREFWTRWHISLSLWIRDYLYVPLVKLFFGDNRPSNLNLIALLCLFISWSLMGMWHGSDLSFLLWGLMHASYLLIYRINIKIIPSSIRNYNLYKFLALSLTLYSVMLAWIPFRANDSSHAFELLSSLISYENIFNLALREDTYLIAFIMTFGYFGFYSIVNTLKIKNELLKLFIIIFKLSLIFIYFQAVDQFIYFQF